MNSLKCAVVGCGTRGKDWIRDLKKSNDVKLIAICDINQGLVEKMSKGDDSIKLYTDYDTLLMENKDLDFVVIATPHFLHAEQTIKAADQKIHVFCEKPMAVNLKECDQMIKTCKENNVNLNIGFQRRYNKNFLLTKKMLEENYIGDVFHANVQALWFRTEPYYLNSSPVPENEDEDWEGWRGHWKTEGGSALINQTIHILDWFLLLCGDLQSVQANANVSMHEYIECEDNVAATVSFKDGKLGLIQAGTSYKFNSDELQFYGNKGTIKFKGWKIKVDGKKTSWAYKRSLKKTINSGTGKDLMGDFIESIKNNTPPPIPGEEGRKTIELIRAIYHSVMSGKKISIPFEDTVEYPELDRLGLECSK